MWHRVALAVVLAVVLGCADLEASTTGNTTLRTGTPAQTELATWALDRFEAAGLALGDLEIEFGGPGLDACEGSAGRAYLDRDPVLVMVCWQDPLIVLHELAHVWESRNVAVGVRESFMEIRRGILSWSGSDVPWEARGHEHAANVVAWGLLEKPRPVLRTYPNDRDSLRAAFILLTGREPLHDGGPVFEPVDRSLFQGRPTEPILSGR